MTQEEVALKTQAGPWPVSRATIGAIETGKTQPALGTVVALTEVLHIDPMEVIDRLKLAAAPIAGHDDRTLEELDQQSKHLFYSGHFREALAILDTLAEQVSTRVRRGDAPGGMTLAAVEVRRATTLKRLGFLTAAKSTAERAIAISATCPSLQAQGFVVLAGSHLQLGNLPMGTHAADRAVELCSGCEPVVQGQAWAQKGRALWEARQYEEARQAFLAARKLADEGGDRTNLVHLEGNIGMCLAELGRNRPARVHIVRAIKKARRFHLPSHEATWRIELGNISLAEGHLDEAREMAEGSLRIARPRENWGTVFRAVMLLHRIAKVQDPQNPDRHRVHYLKRLLPWVEERCADEDVAEFLKEIRGPSESEKGLP